MRRAKRYEQASALREAGLLLREIAAEMDISVSYVSDLLVDPAGGKARQRKRRYARPCRRCGATINPNGLYCMTNPRDKEDQWT